MTIKKCNTQISPEARFEQALICLSLIGKFHQKPINTTDLSHEFPLEQRNDHEFIDVQIIRAARSVGYKAKFRNVRLENLNDKLLPAMAETSDGQFVVIAKVAAEGAVIQHFDLQRPPELIPYAQFAKLFRSRLLMLTPRALDRVSKVAFGFKWFIPALAKYKVYFTDVLLASFFIQLLALASPIFFQVAIDKVMVHKGMTTLDVLAIGFLFVITFEVVLTGLRSYLFSHTTNRVDVSLGSKLYQHMLALPLAYFKSRRVGDTVARIKELDTIREFMTGSALTVVLDMFFTVVFFAIMFYYAPALAWIVVASLPCYFVIALLMGPALRTQLEAKFQRSAENHSFLVESVNGIETIKSLAVEPQLRQRWDEKLANYVRVSFQAFQLNNIYGQLSGYVTKVTGLLILYFGAISVTSGALTIGQFIAFNILAQRVAAPIMRFANLWQDFQQAKISLARLGDVLNTPTETQGSSNMMLPKLRGEVRFEDVEFRYAPNRPPVLNNINLTIKAGEVVGIVGRSGSGKSSLTRLIQRLYLPHQGRVFIDGIDISLLPPAWLRTRIGVVLQENFLFNASVRDNIALSDPSMPLERVIEAARMAGAEEFILQLPEAYDTQIGEQGGMLSGGQRQRLAIARALVSDPPILIFDEATSALDYESEQIIANNMARIAQNRTVFIIAHRLSAVQNADRILVIDKGEVVEQGSHFELLRLGGHYARLSHIQHRGQVQYASLEPEVTP
ncbi:type I secretion system permease/ATPase [Pseudoalteromonas sp. L23]|uniref:type I secretion system permease/ATPase n=1 Tax=unclassified Pseudoalteromonas TaxID=194690 RepID=UPI001EF08F4F|nr:MULTISPECIES: type I secretion system permease/ATPase [unclassified Pseudoalteromonas]MCF7513794.1 type I secretion system permease/ATPase [Pseudoalteromonas sp. L7]MCF7525834.1 type I secretion system permease/ATPase [Pseudoalteromonas sp. L23]MCX2766811.1 type I secretion system permease/ATPase [Pseudoalteromonas sp. B530]